MSAPTPAAPARRLTPLHVLGPVAFALIGIVAVWQGFGLAGYGTDAHTPRVVLAGLALLVCGWVAFRPQVPKAVRALAALAGLGAAAAVWWYAPDSQYKSSMSLRDAARQREWYKERFANPTVEECARSRGLGGVPHLADRYPSLAADLPAEYGRWAATVEGEIVAGYARASTDDPASLPQLREAAKWLGEAHPASRPKLDDAFRQYVERGAKAKIDELRNAGTFTAFDDTAPGRQAFAAAFPEARAALVAVEDEWAASFIERSLATKLPDDPPSERVKCLELQQGLLALKSLDTSDSRFKAARRKLFTRALEVAKTDIAARLEAGEYDVAFGVARKHAFEWDATAAALGPTELQALADLRATCAFLAALYEKAARAPDPIEIAPRPIERLPVAPPPRLKPEVAPPPRPVP